MEITFADITPDEWEALVEHAEREAWVYDHMVEHAKYSGNTEDAERWQLVADHQRERRRAFKSLAAYEEQDYTMYVEQKIVVTRRKHVTLDDVEKTLVSIADDPETEGVERLACNVALDILAEVFDEEEEKVEEVDG